MCGSGRPIDGNGMPSVERGARDWAPADPDNPITSKAIHAARIGVRSL